MAQFAFCKARHPSKALPAHAFPINHKFVLVELTSECIPQVVYNPPTAVCPRHINVYNWVMFYGHSRLTTPGMHVWRMTTVEKLLPQCWAGRDDEELQFLGLHVWLLDNLEHLGKPCWNDGFYFKILCSNGKPAVGEDVYRSHCDDCHAPLQCHSQDWSASNAAHPWGLPEIAAKAPWLLQGSISSVVCS